MHNKNLIILKYLILFILFILNANLHSQSVKGIVTDKKTGESLIGAVISVKNTTTGVSTDLDGNYELKLSPGKYTLAVSYLSYLPYDIIDVTVKNGEITSLNIPMQEDTQSLKEVVVIAMEKLTTETALMKNMRQSTSIVSGVSSQQISKNQDKDASEVIKRIPGISIMDSKFIVARGLSQRYNNVWINNSATPSSESDTRSFSFDMIPSSQIENIMIIKSPQPELPSDFSGGFVKIMTKSIPNENLTSISYATGINTKTHFNDFQYNPGSGTDFLGFDNRHRDMNSIVPKRLSSDNAELTDAVSKNGFNNDWQIKTKKPIPDQKFSIVMNRKFGQQWGLASGLNYSYTKYTYEDMKNTQYGVYNNLQDKPEPDNDYNDNQYMTNARIGALANLTFLLNDKNRFEFRNIFNQLGQDRYTFRTGTDYTSGREKKQEKQEYLYSSRTTYTGQFAGNHDFSNNNNLNWNAGFSYANKNQPDRRIINRTENASTSADPYNGQMYIAQADIERNFVKLNEYVYNAGANYKYDLKLGDKLSATLKAGVYGEYKKRDYNTRDFNYLYNENYFPYSFRFEDVVNDILVPDNYGSGKLYIQEETSNIDSYEGQNKLLASYLAVNIPLNSFNFYGGVRFEHNRMTLTNYKSEVNFDKKDTDYKTTDFFPSLNVSYNLNKDNILRFAYGMSTNRPEFREVSPSSYYDFDLFNRIIGNPELKSAYIHNLDLKYEFYPTIVEMLSLTLFYKHFKDPIEWTFINTGGGSRIYTFENATEANNIGLEIDVKKKLDFIGLNKFSLVANASFIHSKVKFKEDNIENDRPLQGQSPYLVNAGIFYENDKARLNMGLMYNIVGKRIVGIGLRSKNESSTINDDIPDMYEMPRNILDFTFSKKLGENFELSGSVKDILAQKVTYKQYPKFIDTNDNMQEREQITKQYKTGQNLLLTAKYTF